MKGEQYEDLGTLTDACRLGALAAWRSEYAPHKHTDDLLGSDIRKIVVALNILPAGSVDIMVRVQARKYYAHEVYFWKALRVAGVYSVL